MTDKVYITSLRDFVTKGVNFLSTHILSLWDYPVRDKMWVEIKSPMTN